VHTAADDPMSQSMAQNLAKRLETVVREVRTAPATVVGRRSRE
jgi:hypothetical protein